MRTNYSQPTKRILDDSLWMIGACLVPQGIRVGGIYGGIVGLWFMLLGHGPHGSLIGSISVIGIGIGLGGLIGYISAKLVSLLLEMLVSSRLVDWLSTWCSQLALRWILALSSSIPWIIGCFSIFYAEFHTMGNTLETLILASLYPKGWGLFIFWPWVLMGGIVFWKLPMIVDPHLQ